MSNNQHAFQRSPANKKRPMAGTRPNYHHSSPQRVMGKPAHQDHPSQAKVKPSHHGEPSNMKLQPINLSTTRAADAYRQHSGSFMCGLAAVVMLGLFVYMAYTTRARAPRRRRQDHEEMGIELQNFGEEEDQFNLLDDLEAGEAANVPLLLAQPEELSSKAPF